MNGTFITFTVLIVLAAVCLVIVVLLQNGKGEGLASNFTAGNQTFGVRQTADLLENVTWGLVAFIVVLSIATSFTTGTNGADLDVTNKIENAATQSAPEFPAAPTTPAQDAPAQVDPTAN